MAKFCGKCGHKLDENTGLCPNCNKEEIEIKTPPVQEPSENNQNHPQPEEKLTRKQKREKKKADKKAEKERIKASRTLGQKIKRFFIKLLIIILVIAILFGAGFGTLVYYGVVNIPAVNNAIEALGLDDESKTNKDFKQIEGDFTDVKVVDGESAIEAVKSAKEQLDLDNATDELEVKNQNKVDSTTYYRLQQNYQGIPVYGRTIVVMANDDGDVQGLSSNAKDISKVNVEPSADKEKIEQNIESYLEKEFETSGFEYFSVEEFDDSYLYIYSLDGKGELVYNILATTEYGSNQVLVNAHSAKVLYSDSAMDFAQEKFTYKGQSRSQSFVAEKGEKVSQMKFVSKTGTDITVFTPSINHKYDWYYDGNGKVVEWVNKHQPDPSAVDAMSNVSTAYKFYLEKFNHDSYGGNGEDINTYIHITGYRNYKDKDIDGTNNAFHWYSPNGSVLAFYDCYNDDQEKIADYAEQLDAVAHEYTHGVVWHTCNLSDTMMNKMPGAINEAVADIMGYCVEANASTSKHLDWESSVRTSNRQAYEASGKSGQIYHMDDYKGKYKEEHRASTIISYAAYIMNTGGSNNANIGLDELSKLWYRTILVLPSNCTFQNLRESVEMTAKVLNFSDEKQDLISTAFDTVGIFADEDKVPEYNKKLSVSAFGYDGKLYDNYKVTVKGTKNVALWGLFNEDYSKEVTVKKASPVELELPKGTYTISVSHGASSYSKKIKARSFAGDNELNFVTNFGYDDKENKTTSKSDNEVNTPVRTTSDERDIVLVLDSSGSMSGDPMKETKNAATKFVGTILDEDASLGIVTYDDEAKMSSDFSTNETHLVDTIDKISADGGTNIEAGLKKAENMLSSSKAKKKIVVLMSDGMPNTGLEGDELIAYADELKEEGIYIYTLGFFNEMYDKSSAQYLMEGIANEGCHYEVSDADSLVFFFGDIADQINGQKYIYVRIACPVDVKVSYDGETLNSSEKRLNTRTNFGTLTFEETEEQEDNNDKDKKNDDSTVKILRLKEGVPYDINIEGTGRGSMNYSIGFMDENGEYSDFRRFRNISINRNTSIDTVAEVADSTVLNVDEDGDGKYDIKYKAKANSYGEEVDYTFVVYIVVSAVIAIALLIVILVICKKVKKKKQNKN